MKQAYNYIIKREEDRKMTSLHYRQDRQERENLINNVVGRGKIVDRFIIDKHHKNGKEVHCITTTGVIVIFNLKSRKLITKIIARPYQIKRYYEKGKAPQEIVKKAIYNQKMGYNI